MALSRDAGTSFDPRLVKALTDHLQQNPEMQEALIKPAPELRGVSLDK
jgi:HD-GYP domain-containing protein (c-di-GMP phosphodiesterase class II)